MGGRSTPTTVHCALLITIVCVISCADAVHFGRGNNIRPTTNLFLQPVRARRQVDANHPALPLAFFLSPLRGGGVLDDTDSGIGDNVAGAKDDGAVGSSSGKRRRRRRRRKSPSSGAGDDEAAEANNESEDSSESVSTRDGATKDNISDDLNGDDKELSLDNKDEPRSWLESYLSGNAAAEATGAEEGAAIGDGSAPLSAAGDKEEEGEKDPGVDDNANAADSVKDSVQSKRKRKRRRRRTTVAAKPSSSESTVITGNSSVDIGDDEGMAIEGGEDQARGDDDGGEDGASAQEAEAAAEPAAISTATDEEGRKRRVKQCKRRKRRTRSALPLDSSSSIKGDDNKDAVCDAAVDDSLHVSAVTEVSFTEVKPIEAEGTDRTVVEEVSSADDVAEEGEEKESDNHIETVSADSLISQGNDEPETSTLEPAVLSSDGDDDASSIEQEDIASVPMTDSGAEKGEEGMVGSGDNEEEEEEEDTDESEGDEPDLPTQGSEGLTEEVTFDSNTEEDIQGEIESEEDEDEGATVGKANDEFFSKVPKEGDNADIDVGFSGAEESEKEASESSDAEQESASEEDEDRAAEEDSSSAVASDSASGEGSEEEDVSEEDLSGRSVELLVTNNNDESSPNEEEDEESEDGAINERDQEETEKEEDTASDSESSGEDSLVKKDSDDQEESSDSFSASSVAPPPPPADTDQDQSEENKMDRSTASANDSHQEAVASIPSAAAEGVEPAVTEEKPVATTTEAQTQVTDGTQTEPKEEDDSSKITVSVVTWNMAEKSPSESEARFIRRFRKAHPSLSQNKVREGSDIVMIGGQETEDIKPRRAEGSRSRELRRLMIKMLGKKYVPIAIHSLGGVQFGLFVRRDILHEIEHVNLADVACGVGNVFHNKGAICAYVQMKARACKNKEEGSPNRKKSVKMLFISAHMAAHVKNVDARNEDFWRIASELEGQAPPRFLRPKSHLREQALSDAVGSGGSHLMDSMDHVFFCGDLNYRIDLPREITEYTVMNTRECLERDDARKADKIRLSLLRHDQLTRVISEGAAFSGFAEGKITFPPTFKYDKGTKSYDTSHKQRVPAWTDRILFKPHGVRVLEYGSQEDATHSDHRPVYGTFLVDIAGKKLPERRTAKPKQSRKKSRSKEQQNATINSNKSY